ncbi:hypothetical protein FE784_32760 [Paenibacillus hemerocallicola]|uniref:Lipoprotein n=1 Tax=Paenibacillus hemerocallicola TaxID=1172614 RepID=A0A5C4SZ98_9BACL|nr:hypothetical protein [Paenibacillus hemerocallicola]TNJ62003.1 hypothetical protein FE784_32760 [Paenibacillus hemerocallicola]
MLRKICITLAAALLVLTAAGCQQANYRMKEQRNPNHDPRGMKDESYLEDRVNTNLPQGGTSPKDELDMQQNIRPGDANGGNPPTVEGGNILEPGSMGKTPR